MNPSSSPPPTRPPARRLWLWAFLAVPLSLLIVVAAWVYSCFHLSSDVRVLRNALTRSTGVEWREQIALNANWLTLGAIRAGLSNVKLDPAARAALQSVCSAGVGVYQLAAETPPPDRATMLVAANTAMAARGWERVVVVINAHDLVAVYSPKTYVPFHRLKCCVVVFSGRELVLVSTQADPEPLVGYALAQPRLVAQAPQSAQH